MRYVAHACCCLLLGAAALQCTRDAPEDTIPDCEEHPCFRAFECVAQCGGDLVYSGCCPCPAGTIDRVTQCAQDAGADA